MTYPIRINRYLAMKKICSRREADAFIEKKIVTINGKIAKLGDKVGESDVVAVNTMAKDRIKRYLYFAYNKEKGIVTHSPEAGQKSILQVSSFPQQVYPIGRLDRQSRGLILMTNDGRITDRLLNPSYDHEKEYMVEVNKPITKLFLKHMQQGIVLEDFTTKPAIVKQMDELKFKITLTEGKKHQIRRMCSAMGYDVVDLRRVRIMNIQLGKLPAGRWRKIEGPELEKLLKNLGIN